MRISDWSSDVCSSDLRGRAWIISLDQLAHPEADEELHDEIDGQRDRDPDDVAGDGDDLAALEDEHRDDGEEQCDEGDRRDPRQEVRLVPVVALGAGEPFRSEEHTSELQSLMRTSYAVFCLKTKK